ncbi:hypothetical protein BCV69DRAFT_295745 [Microstroma glucosiphilum]|uniref:Uncharacterized protein n=1 Tax=Pseudomicrostroma glucosiphilum TaxID=1684307 RepID=A0A316U4L7_9BASI|nr:hypothetical protein BCV69DRAFT_295745 [Pseudomicrostroma glucosiphilum]PWN17885.1 hypothetical protein BCV69DRAFT_295745 [Pseudomicrostroma glucosiphilum]
MTADSDSRLCCCCIPVRVGIILLAPITFLLSSALAGAIIFHLWSSGSKLPVSTQAIGGLYTALMIILAIASFLGLIGSARKVSTLVRVYFFALLAAWVLGIGLGTAYTTDTFIHRDEIIQICQARQERLWKGNEALIKLGQDACRFKFKLWAAIFICLWVIFHAVFLYFVVIASRASRILRDDGVTVRNTYSYPGGPPSYGRTASDISNSSTLPVIVTPPRTSKGKKRTGSGGTSCSSSSSTGTHDGEKTPQALNVSNGQGTSRDRGKASPPGGHGPSTPWQARFSGREMKTPIAVGTEGSAWGAGGPASGSATPGGGGGATRAHALSHSSTWSGYVTAPDMGTPHRAKGESEKGDEMDAAKSVSSPVASNKWE